MTDHIDRLAPHLAPSDGERDALMRDAIAAYAIARAQARSLPFAADDEAVERELKQITPRALNALTLNADSPESLGRTARALMAEGKLLPRREYLPEELQL